jgi:ABC-type branched-subunit amino acid transport system substrate-binding protein
MRGTMQKRQRRRMPADIATFRRASFRRGGARVGRPLRIGLLVPQSGPIGLFGPSSLTCSMLAADELNAEGGILGRPVELITGDGGGSCREIEAEAERMIAEDGVEAIVGSHISTNRLALVDAIGGRIPYVYTTLYEGGQHSFGVFVCGETPEQELRPLIHWLARHKGARRWHLIGNDYVFPRISMALAKRYIAEVAGSVVGEEYVPFIMDDFHPSIDRIAASRADAVLIYLVGQDSILFNRQFAARGLQSGVLRAAPVLCENMLLGTGADATRNLFSATGFAGCMETRAVDTLRRNYRRTFGEYAPVLNRFGVSCYEGLHLLAALARRAGSFNLFKMQAVSDGTVIHGPRGACTLSGNHLSTVTYIAEAAGVDFRAIDRIGAMAAAPPSRSIWYPDAGSA